MEEDMEVEKGTHQRILHVASMGLQPNYFEITAALIMETTGHIVVTSQRDAKLSNICLVAVVSKSKPKLNSHL
jgi:hypothetical protein